MGVYIEWHGYRPVKTIHMLRVRTFVEHSIYSSSLPNSFWMPNASFPRFTYPISSPAFLQELSYFTTTL